MNLPTYIYDGGLDGLFAILSVSLASSNLPSSVRRENGGGDDLLPFECGDEKRIEQVTATSGGIEAHASRGAALLRFASELAWQDFIHAWMSELPVDRAAIAFAFRVVRTAQKSKDRGSFCSAAVEYVRTDRGDDDVRTTHAAAYKSTREIHRLLGLLRFSRAPSGRLIARCEPDHAVLPALADHFYDRLGAQPWAIVDLKRSLALVRDISLPPRLVTIATDDPELAVAYPQENWESLWRGYHRAISIDSRENRRLQRNLMPVRYWKYLTELYDVADGGHDENGVVHSL